VSAGSERVITGKPPFSLVVGNANNVAVTMNGKTVELTPHSKGNVARLTLE
jgi:cytoskeleton protein RodZ